MAFLGGGLFGQRKPSGGLGLLGGRKGKTGQVVLRGQTKRAYSFDIYPSEAASALPDTGAVYCYARAVPADASGTAGRDAGSAGLQIGYVGRTANMGRQGAAHDRLGHFTGHGIDLGLVLWIEQAPIRADIERDLRELHNPVLNDLLRSYQPGQTC